MSLVNILNLNRHEVAIMAKSTTPMNKQSKSLTNTNRNKLGSEGKVDKSEATMSHHAIDTWYPNEKSCMLGYN